jgi:hypothetical protein
VVWNLVAALGSAVPAILLDRSGRRLGIVGWLLVLWSASCVLAYAVSTPVGDNVVRLRYVVLPLALVVAARAAFRPRFLALVAVAATAAFAIVPDVSTLAAKSDGAEARASFWAPAIAYLHGHTTRQFRVEVVQTAGRWESYWLPRAGIALARGWYRQLDVADNPLLYRQAIAPVAYSDWLHRLAVSYVVLPPTQLDTQGAGGEARLLRSGRSGLPLAYATAGWRIYRVPRPQQLLSGRRAARILRLGHESVLARVSGPGRYLLRIRFMPYWQIRRGAVCLARTAGGMTRIEARRAGVFELRVATLPSVVETALGDADGRC